jgi:hypothetical protein
MFDPSALGTLRIGLDAIQADADRAAHGPIPTTTAAERGRATGPGARPSLARRAHSRLRVTLAGGLRRIADALEPRPTEPIAG